MRQFVLTPAAGKRLMARAVLAHSAVREALGSGTVVVVAGTTNGYVAEEILRDLGQVEGFSRRRFYRGLTVPPAPAKAAAAPPAGQDAFPGDVVVTGGEWRKGKTIFDVIDDLKAGDVVLKGANAVDLARRRAAVLIGDAKGGTIAAALGAVVGRRVRLILPVGLEKRVSADLDELAARLNAPGATGPRLLPAPGEVLTELDAVPILSGAAAELVAGGGVAGAEGAVRLAVSGSPDEERTAGEFISDCLREPPFAL